MSVRASLRRFSLDLSEPLRTARGDVETRDGFLVRVDRDGVVGLGEATPLEGWTESLPECRSALQQAVERLESDGSDAALGELDGAPAARHALSLALLDRESRADGTSIARALGGTVASGWVPVNATVSDAPVEETVTAATEAVDDGFDCLKLKVGARSVAADVERVTAVRESVGSAVELRADANGAWSPAEAERALGSLADVGVSHVEQPLAADDLAGHAALRGGPVGVALDETLAKTGVEGVLDAGAADVLVLKPMALGGVDRAFQAATAARAANATPVVTTTIDGVVARTAAVHLAAAIPDVPACGLATAELLADDLAPDPAPVADGAVEVPRGNGLGVAGAWSER